MSNTDSNILIIERLTRVEEKIDSFLDKASASDVRAGDHESRLRTLEQSSYRLLGMGTLVAALGGIAGARLVDVFVGT